MKMTVEQVFDGKTLKDWRNEHRYTQKNVADKMGLPRDYIAHIEIGDYPFKNSFKEKLVKSFPSKKQMFATQLSGLHDLYTEVIESIIASLNNLLCLDAIPQNELDIFLHFLAGSLAEIEKVKSLIDSKRKVDVKDIDVICQSLQIKTVSYFNALKRLNDPSQLDKLKEKDMADEKYSNGTIEEEIIKIEAELVNVHQMCDALSAKLLELQKKKHDDETLQILEAFHKSNKSYQELMSFLNA